MRALEVVEGDHPVGEDEEGVRQRRGVGAGALAVGLQLVAEVAGEAAVEVEGKVVGEVAQAPHLAREVVEDRLVQDPRLAAGADGQLAAVDVVGDRRPERPGGVAHEGEAGAAVEHVAVEPEGVGAGAVEVGEGALGVAGGVEALDPQLEPRAAGDRAARRARVEAHGARLAAAGVLDREVAEAGQHRPPVLGADRLGMELQAPLRPLAVGDRHQDPVAGPGDALQRRRQRLLDAERVVADDLELARQAGEDARVLVGDGADPAVHRLRGVDDLGAVHRAEALVAEADAEQRHLGVADRVGADAEVLLAVGVAGPRRDHDVVEVAARAPAPPSSARRCGRRSALRRWPRRAAGRGCR